MSDAAGADTPATADSDYVEGLMRRSEEAEARALDLVRSFSQDQFNWKPGPDRWSVGQCLDHLLTANRLYLVRIRAVLPGARAADRGRPFRPGPVGSRFARSLGSNATRKQRTPRTFAPSASTLPVELAREFAAQQAELRDVMSRSLTVDLTRTRVASPVSRLIRFRLGDILMLLVNHQERHLNQAERVTRAEGFPNTAE